MPLPRNRRFSDVEGEARAQSEAAPAPRRRGGFGIVVLGATSALAVAASCSSVARSSVTLVVEPKRADAGNEASLSLAVATVGATPTARSDEASNTAANTANAANAAAANASAAATITANTPPTHARYPLGAVHSPLTRTIVARLASTIAAGHRTDVFAKIGDSNTVNVHALHCFSGRDVQLAGHEALQPTIDFFRRTLADSAYDSFTRPTSAAKVGWTTSRALAGIPSPIEEEVTAIHPAFGLVLLGTNDTFPWRVHAFESDLQRVVGSLLDRGVVPALTTLPPRGDTPEANALVPEMNAVIRVVAQARQIPLVDPWGRLADVPGYGLAGDGVHLEVHSSIGRGRGCWFDDVSLRQAMNVRNLASLEALDRLRRSVVLGELVDPEPAPLSGAGTWDAPYQVDTLPFVDDGDTRSRANVAAFYPCGGQEQGGGEVVYSVALASAMKLRARVFTDDAVDLDLHWLDGPDAKDCAARGDKTLEVRAAAGMHRLVIDTFGEAAKARGGTFRLTLVRVE